MDAGRELDALVAEKVMGQTAEVREKWRGTCLCGRNETCAVCDWPLSYSADIAAAWEVVEKLKSEGWLWTVSHCADGEWRIELEKHDGPLFGYESHELPAAICLAALKAVGAM